MKTAPTVKTKTKLAAWDISEITFAGKPVSKNVFTEQVNTIPQRKAEFIDFGFLDLSKIKLTSATDNNTGVRAQEKDWQTAESISRMRCSLASGWNIHTVLPIIDIETGKIIGGRHRIRAAQQNGEKYLPVAGYRYNDKSVRNLLACMSNENSRHLYAKPNRLEDLAYASFEVWKQGGLYYSPNDTSDEADDDIIAFLQECGIDVMFDMQSASGKGMQTKVLNMFKHSVRSYEQGNTPLGETVITRTAKEWHEWLKDTVNIETDIESENDDEPTDGLSEYLLITADHSNNTALSFFRHIPKRVKGKMKPLKIIMVLRSRFPEKHLAYVKNTMKAWDEVYNSCYAVSRQNPDLINCVERPYEFYGMVPQMTIKHHAETRQTIIPMQEYLRG